MAKTPERRLIPRHGAFCSHCVFSGLRVLSWTGALAACVQGKIQVNHISLLSILSKSMWEVHINVKQLSMKPPLCPPRADFPGG